MNDFVARTLIPSGTMTLKSTRYPFTLWSPLKLHPKNTLVNTTKNWLNLTNLVCSYVLLKEKSGMVVFATNLYWWNVQPIQNGHFDQDIGYPNLCMAIGFNQNKLVGFEPFGVGNRARRQSGFPTFISCQRQDANVLPERRQSHQVDKLCDVSTVPLVARWPVFSARGSDADGEPH